LVILLYAVTIFTIVALRTLGLPVESRQTLAVDVVLFVFYGAVGLTMLFGAPQIVRIFYGNDKA
jgi:hypothetical protein